MMYHAGEKSLRVSIPRSEFWSFGLDETVHALLHRPRVSIPRSEFWSFGRCAGAYAAVDSPVSIPRSEFWSFGRHYEGDDDGN